MALEILAEPGVLQRDGVLADVRNAEEGQGARQDAQAGADVEGVLGGGDGVGPARGLDVGEHPGADEGADLARCRREPVVLAPDARGAGLGRQQADVVPRAELA